MEAVVPYASNFVTPAIRQAAITAGRRYAYSFAGAQARRALNFGARNIGRSVFRRMSNLNRTARRATGVSPGTATANRTDQLSGDIQSHNLNTQYLITTNAIERDTGSVPAGNFRININSRMRGIAFISGFSIKINFQNQSTTSDCVIRWALLKKKAPGGDIKDGFFRWNGTSRDVNFDNVNRATDMMNLPISTDKYYIYKTGKFQLGAKIATGVTGSNSNRRNTKFLKRYIRLKRQIRYNDDSDQNPEDEIIFVHWCTHPFTTVLTTADQYRTEGDIVCYFRNPW